MLPFSCRNGRNLVFISYHIARLSWHSPFWHDHQEPEDILQYDPSMLVIFWHSCTSSKYCSSSSMSGSWNMAKQVLPHCEPPRHWIRISHVHYMSCICCISSPPIINSQASPLAVSFQGTIASLGLQLKSKTQRLHIWNYIWYSMYIYIYLLLLSPTVPTGIRCPPNIFRGRKKRQASLKRASGGVCCLIIVRSRYLTSWQGRMG